MNSCELVSFVTAVSCGIAKCVPKEDLPILTAVFGQIASTLATITVKEETLSEKKAPVDVDYNNAILTSPTNNPLQ